MLPGKVVLPNGRDKMLPKDFLNHTKVTNRAGHFGQQWHAGGILTALSNHKPSNAYAILGLTNQDLYSGDQNSFCLGYASYSGGVGTFSFKRYDPRFSGLEVDKEMSANASRHALANAC